MKNAPLNPAHDLARYYEKVAAQIHTLVQPLSDDDIWQRPYPYGNSIGHLLLHLTGNLNYYIGAQIAATGYVRNRDLEFIDASRRPKATVLQDFTRAIAMVKGTLVRQSGEDWGAFYTAKGMEDAENRFTVFLRCAAHLQHHAAQMIYLTKEIARQK
ncbi:MAG: DUF1572 domain-containing protein [Acidobacteriia bacterium]|nr:DUF1572 domain-containing protein [Terriglobia bacterium]